MNDITVPKNTGLFLDTHKYMQFNLNFGANMEYIRVCSGFERGIVEQKCKLFSQHPK